MSDRLPDYFTFASRATYVAGVVQALLRDYEGMQGRDGAYFCVSHQGTPIAGGLVGDVPKLDKREKYDRLSREKCRRLFEFRDLGHRLSRQSMNESEEKYAGAVSGNENEYGFSGYLPDVDEIAGAMLAVGCGDMSRKDARKLLRDNRYMSIVEFYFRDPESD
ncbi:MAG TPA: hypothetical protein VMH91_02885 [Candidatus Paceibacterota bacterium]|nr:hypothetical protein [Candidatus Paceibacterota bacterium]